MANEVRLSDALVSAVISHLDNKLTGSTVRITQDQIFEDLKDLVVAEIPESSKSRFKAAMGTALKEGRIVGFKGKLGRAGGMVRISAEDKQKSSLAKEDGSDTAEPAPVTESSEFVFRGRKYIVNMSAEKLERMLTKVFCVKENCDGELTFDSRVFSPDDDKVSELIENFGFYFGAEENQPTV